MNTSPVVTLLSHVFLYQNTRKKNTKIIIEKLRGLMTFAQYYILCIAVLIIDCFTGQRFGDRLSFFDQSLVLDSLSCEEASFF